MRVLIVRHGEAEKTSPDHSRKLNDTGREEVRKMAEAVLARGFRPTVILQSGLVRAKETGEILAQVLEPADGMIEAEGLCPEDSPYPWANTLEETEDDVALVSHMPFVGLLAAFLLDSNEDVHFQTGAAVCLERKEDGSWKKLWKERG